MCFLSFLLHKWLQFRFALPPSPTLTHFLPMLLNAAYNLPTVIRFVLDYLHCLDQGCPAGGLLCWFGFATHGIMPPLTLPTPLPAA